MFVNHCCNLKGHQIKWNCWGKKHKLLPYDSRHCNPCSHLAFNKLNNCTLFLFKKILFGVQMKEVRDVQKSMWKRLWWMCIFLTRTDTVELTRGIWFVYACASLISVKLQTYCHSWQQFFFFFFFLHWQFKKNKKKQKKNMIHHGPIQNKISFLVTDFGMFSPIINSTCFGKKWFFCVGVWFWPVPALLKQLQAEAHSFFSFRLCRSLPWSGSTALQV